VRDGRKKVTALEKPNILKITGGLFKESFLKVARDYNRARLGEQAIEANFMIIDDGLAAIAATPEKFDVVVTTNMFGDIGSDIAAKLTGGVGLVSSNNTNPNNPRAVSMFETMGGTADDIAGQNKANPVALIDAAAEMLLHIGGAANIRGAEIIKAAVRP
jgi:isocitrate dehydrogenase